MRRATLPAGASPPRDRVGSGYGTKLGALRVVDEDALHGEGVEVDVEVQRRSEALDRGHRAAAPPRMPRRAARRRSKPSSARTKTASTARQSR